VRTLSSQSLNRFGAIATFGTLAVLTIVIASTSFAQSGSAGVQIKDKADMFSKKAIDEAAKLLGPPANAPVPVMIETVETLDGVAIEVATRRHAESSGGAGIYVLISRRDHKIDVLASKAFAGMMPEATRERIQKAFIQGLRSGDFDAGLLAGAQAISHDVLSLKRFGTAADWTGQRTSTAEAGSSSLVLHNQVRLTLAGAQRIIAGAEAKAVAMGLKVNIAVVDDGGHMFAFERMDGARPASIYTANTKAVTAATFRAATGPLPAGTTAPDPLFNLSLQLTALAGGGKLTTLGGGIPVIVDNQVIGAIGVGGGTAEQDTAVARAGIEAFEAALKAPAEVPREAPPAEK
jgi:glc operon protein GlcG